MSTRSANPSSPADSQLPRTVVILGARGRLGASAVDAFASAGWRVVGHCRRAGDPRGEHMAARVHTPLDQTATLAAEIGRADVVVHAVNPVYTRWAQEALPLARAGMDLAERLGARFMLPGNVYHYGHAMPALLSVDTPAHPDTRKGTIRMRIEAEMGERARAGLSCVVLRAGDFFGGGLGSWFDLMLARHAGKGRLVYPGPTDRVHAWAYLPDLADALARLAGSPLAPGLQCFHFAGHAPTGDQMLDAIESAAHRLGLGPKTRFKRGGVPWPMIRLAGLVAPMAREIAEMAYLWQQPHALDDTELRDMIGAPTETPLADAVTSALAALQLAHRAG